MTSKHGLVVLLSGFVAVLAGCAESGDSADAVNPDAGTPEAVRLSHDYAKDAATTETFTIPVTAATYDVVVRIGGTGPTVCAPNTDARLVVRTPTSETYADLRSNTNTVVSSGTGNSGCSQKVEGGVPLAAGAWTVEYTGSGPFLGVVEITPSA